MFELPSHKNTQKIKSAYLLCDKASLRGDIWQVLISLFQNTPITAPKNKLFIHEMHLNMQLLRRGLILLNSKPRFRVSALHFVAK